MLDLRRTVRAQGSVQWHEANRRSSSHGLRAGLKTRRRKDGRGAGARYIYSFDLYPGSWWEAGIVLTEPKGTAYVVPFHCAVGLIGRT